MCISGDKKKCRAGRNVSLGGAQKLITLANDNYDVISRLKESAPVLYTKLFNSDIKKGGMDYIYKYQKVMYGGLVENKELNKLREEIEQIRSN
jgi:hypothetical protein